MASFADLLTPKSRKVFDSIIDDEKQKREHEIQEHEKRVQQKYDKNGFKTFDAMIEYLQATGKRVFVDFCNHEIYFQWDSEQNKIRHHVWENTECDMTIGFSNLYYTIDEFIEKFCLKRDDKGINRWGYVDSFLRDDEHSVDDYEMDDRFFPMF